MNKIVLTYVFYIKVGLKSKVLHLCNKKTNCKLSSRLKIKMFTLDFYALVVKLDIQINNTLVTHDQLTEPCCYVRHTLIILLC